MADRSASPPSPLLWVGFALLLLGIVGFDAVVALWVFNPEGGFPRAGVAVSAACTLVGAFIVRWTSHAQRH